MVAEERDASGSVEVMIKFEDGNAVLSAAREAGADVTAESHDWEYGERQGSLIDPFGQTWVLTETVRDTDPTAWGGRIVVPRVP